MCGKAKGGGGGGAPDGERELIVICGVPVRVCSGLLSRHDCPKRVQKKLGACCPQTLANPVPYVYVALRPRDVTRCTLEPT